MKHRHHGLTTYIRKGKRRLRKRPLHPIRIKKRMGIVSGEDINEQLHLGQPKEFKDEFEIKKRLHAKPGGGFWTSTYTPNEKYKSAWHKWTNEEMFDLRDKGVIVKPKDDAKIFEINKQEDLNQLIRDYPDEKNLGEGIDFNKVKSDFDAVRINNWRLANEFGWDVESTVWFRPKFDVVDEINIQNFGQELLDFDSDDEE